MGAAEDGNENKNYVRKIKAKVIDITELTCYNGAKKPAGKKYTFCQPVSMKRKQPEGNPLRLFSFHGNRLAKGVPSASRFLDPIVAR